MGWHQVKYLISDIDGTVADCGWRQRWARAARNTKHPAERAEAWREFHRRCVDDPAWTAERELLQVMAAADYRIIYLTGRTDEFRQETLTWLARHSFPFPYLLLMRPVASTARNTDYKMGQFQHITKRILAPGEKISFVLEDDERCVAMWRSLGLTCFQPRSSSY